LSFDPDRILDRRRLRHGLIFWRTLAILAIVVMAIALVARFGIGSAGDQRVARLWLDDIVVDDPVRDDALAAIAKDRRVRALIDALGGEDEARAWLAETQAIPLTLRIEDIERSEASGLIGLIGERLRQTLLPPRLRLDGAISVWQAEPAK